MIYQIKWTLSFVAENSELHSGYHSTTNLEKRLTARAMIYMFEILGNIDEGFLRLSNID